MNGVITANAVCPYCGEAIELLVDCSVNRQSYVEDCEVCCRPITLHVVIQTDGSPTVSLSREDGM